MTAIKIQLGMLGGTVYDDPCFCEHYLGCGVVGVRKLVTREVVNVAVNSSETCAPARVMGHPKPAIAACSEGVKAVLKTTRENNEGNLPRPFSRFEANIVFTLLLISLG